MVVVMDNYTRIVLTVIAVLLTLVAIPLWTNQSPEISSSAVAAEPGIPDAGQQLNELISLTADNKASLELISEKLSKGTLKVIVVEKDEDEKSKPVFTPNSKITFRKK